MSNKGDSYIFRDRVALAHVEAGFTTVRRAGEPKGLSASERIRGDLEGLPVTVGVRNHLTPDLSEALREVQAESQAEGTGTYVSIQRRRGADVLDSFVTTDLRTWLRILARLHPEVVAS